MSERGAAEPELRAEIAVLNGELANAKALQDAGKVKPSLDRLRQVRGRVDATNYAPLRVVWMQSMAHAETESDPKAAAADYEEAVALADVYRLDEIRARAALDLSALNEGWFSRPEEAHRWLRVASSATQRMGGDAHLEALMDNQEGWLAGRENRVTDRFERGLERLQSAGIDDPRLRARIFAGMASMYGNAGHPNEAIQDDRLAIAEVEKLYGLQHPTVALYYDNLSGHELDAGKLKDGLSSASHALAILDEIAHRGDVASESTYRAVAELGMGVVLVRMGRASDAVGYLTRARELLEKTTGLANLDGLRACVGLARAYRVLGDVQRAAHLLDEAESFAPKEPDSDSYVADILVERAKLEAMHGPSKRAVSLAGNALDLLRDASAVDAFQVADARLTLARALKTTRGDLARARELAEQAKGGFEELSDRRNAEEASALLAELGQ